jgi:hypothetical protein
MKNAPFLLSSVLALVAVIFSLWSFGSAQTNNGLQAELLKKQSEIQDLTQSVTLQNQEYNRMTETINTGATVAQKLGPPILRDMGYFAAKKNDKLKDILVRYKFDDFIPNADQLKAMDKEIDKIKAQQSGGAPAPAPAPAPTHAPAPAPAATGAPSLRP